MVSLDYVICCSFRSPKLKRSIGPEMGCAARIWKITDRFVKFRAGWCYDNITAPSP